MASTKNKSSSGTVTDAAIEAALLKIDGIEMGTNTFNPIGAQLLREGDPRVINLIRKQRKQIDDARRLFGAI